MAWKTLNFPGLSTAPAVVESDRRVEARTRWSMRLLALWGYERYLWADGEAQVISLDVRRWWGFRQTTVIPFRQIEYIQYSYGERPVEWGNAIVGQSVSEPVRAVELNWIDWFSVSVKLRGIPKPALLFRCVGEGGAATELAASAMPWGLGGWLIRLLMIEGDEERRSRALATALARVTGKLISSPLEEDLRQFHVSDTIKCPVCGHEIGRAVERCVYCASRL